MNETRGQNNDLLKTTGCIKSILAHVITEQRTVLIVLSDSIYHFKLFVIGFQGLAQQ